jgi:long-chain acyl-CoA synthetase
VVVMGNGRGYLVALITGAVTSDQAQAALDHINLELPHYKQARGFHLVSESFTIDSGLLTANGKLKRDMIADKFRSEIDAMYESSRNQATKTA